jgi:hypothetical protein
MLDLAESVQGKLFCKSLGLTPTLLRADRPSLRAPAICCSLREAFPSLGDNFTQPKSDFPI